MKARLWRVAAALLAGLSCGCGVFEDAITRKSQSKQAKVANLCNVGQSTGDPNDAAYVSGDIQVSPEICEQLWTERVAGNPVGTKFTYDHFTTTVSAISTDSMTVSLKFFNSKPADYVFKKLISPRDVCSLVVLKAWEG